MKKSAALLMVFVLAFLFCACKKDKKENTVTGADIEYYAKIGQIPESPTRFYRSLKNPKILPISNPTITKRAERKLRSP